MSQPVVYAVSLQYEGVQAIYATREAAEAALEDYDEYPEYLPYYVEEWVVR